MLRGSGWSAGAYDPLYCPASVDVAGCNRSWTEVVCEWRSPASHRGVEGSGDRLAVVSSRRWGTLMPLHSGYSSRPQGSGDQGVRAGRVCRCAPLGSRSTRPGSSQTGRSSSLRCSLGRSSVSCLSSCFTQLLSSFLASS